MEDRSEETSMLRVALYESLPKAPHLEEVSRLRVPLYEGLPQVTLREGTRFVVRASDPPYLAPPYSSMLDTAIAAGVVQKINNKAYYAAMHPLKLHAGKAPMPNGELGRPAAADPINTPELLGGRILRTNV